MDKPSLPKGTRDFGPVQMAKRQFILNTIRKVFEMYGFQPLETPAMENLITLTGKYGDEGDKLLFKVLDSGNYLKGFKEYSTNVDFGFRIGQILRDLFDTVNQKLGQNRKPSQVEILALLEVTLSELAFKDDQEQRYFKAIIRLNKEEISNRIVDWISPSSLLERVRKIIQPKNSIEKAINFFDRRNKLVQGLSDEMLNPFISEKGLRYDLTVPFARYVVMNRQALTLPFKRYQIQPVWRADRPQKGRYREFYQCDADVVGTDSLVCEAEIILMIKEVFAGLNIDDYTIKINHRGVLSALAQASERSENENSLFVSIDKLDKTDEQTVRNDLRSKGFSESGIDSLFKFLNFEGSNIEKLALFEASFPGHKSLVELREVFSLVGLFGSTDDHIQFDLSLARGLSYYTGCIFEVKINNIAMGSVTGGGRYDNLTQKFDSKEKLSGVGISFGIDRIYDVMEELRLFPEAASVASTVVVCHLDESSREFAFKTVQALRKAGIAAEVYPDLSKLKKQLEYADKKGIPYAIVVGEDEVKTGVLTIKNMKTGEQEKLAVEQILKKMSEGGN